MTYKDLIVWQKSIELTIKTYALTKLFPQEEMYGITSQLKRAAVSIPSNIAEGFGRRSKKEHTHFYFTAFGSALEMETQLIISKKLKFAKESDFLEVESLLEEVLKMLNKMTSSNRTNN